MTIQNKIENVFAQLEVQIENKLYIDPTVLSDAASLALTANNYKKALKFSGYVLDNNLNTETPDITCSEDFLLYFTTCYINAIAKYELDEHPESSEWRMKWLLIHYQKFSTTHELNLYSDYVFNYLFENTPEISEEDCRFTLQVVKASYAIDTTQKHLLFEMGVLQLYLKDYNVALNSFLEAYSANPDSRIAFHLAICYYALHNMEQTIYYYKRAQAIENIKERFLAYFPQALDFLNTIYP